MNKIVFIEPKSPNLHIFSRFALPRLGPVLLGTIAKKHNWQVSVYFEENHEIDWDDVATADIVGISTITPTAPRGYAIADRIGEMGIPVVFGGPHVTFLPEEALEHGDYVIRGEAENILPHFLQSVQHGDVSGVQNLVYKRDNEVIYNEKCTIPVDLDTLPFPEFGLVKGEAKTVAGKKIIPMQTSRGCPFDCSFCSVTGMFGRKYRFRSSQNIIEELKRYNSKDNAIFFYDDNFAANPKHTVELLETMIAEKIKCKWSTQVRADIARDEQMIQLMKRAGCETVYIGFESVDSESLRSVKKQQTIEEMVRAAKVFEKYKIHIHGMFILGIDDETMLSVKESVKFAKRHRLNSAQFLILTPLPGTRYYDMLLREKRIAFSDWSLYDAHHVVFQPRRFSLADLQRAQIWAHAHFYSFFESFKRLLKFKIVDVSIAHYARKLNVNWQRQNKLYLRLLDILKPRKGQRVTADYRQEIILDSTK